MLHIASTAHTRPDGIFFVIGHYVLMGVSFLFCVLMLLATTVALAWHMLTNNDWQLSGLLLLSMIVTAGTIVGGWMLICALGLWLRKHNARESAIILSSVLTTVTLLSIPLLHTSYGAKLGLLLITVAIGIAISNASAVWYLLRPNVKHYLGCTA
jgi:predicted permease